MAILRSRQKAVGYDFTPDAEGRLRSRAGADGATAAVLVTAGGVRLSSAEGGFALGVETTRVGREGSPASRRVTEQHADGQELVIDREDEVEERYLAGPLGLEQSFVVGSAPGGTGPLTLEVAFTGLTPELAEGATDRVLLRDEARRVRAGYRDLVAVDAEGRELGARMDVGEAGVTLVVDDTGAVYPVRVDPVVWIQQAELTASDGAQSDGFGVSVAVSGGTAVVGAHAHKVGSNASQGAAYVFVQSGTTWTQQAELTASDGAADDSFGQSVAVSGGTAVVSAPGRQVGSNVSQGAAYVFVQSGTTWTQQQELTASDGAAHDFFGNSAAVSDGTAVVGAYNHTVGSNVHQGVAYVFVQGGTTWTQQQELTASDGAADDFFGNSVAVSGGTAVVGAGGHDAYQGAAYVFVQSGTLWTQQAELTASDGAADDFFGTSVAVSGGTAVVGPTQHKVGSNVSQGAAYVFVQSGTTWTQQAELTASDGVAYDAFGYFVAVSGSTVVVGAFEHKVGSNASQGAAYVFVTTCDISGVPYGTGAVNPTNACQVCAPTTSTTTWSNEPDGTGCASGGVCSSGTCVADCFIGGVLIPAGTVDPLNGCQICTPATSTTTWSNEPDGLSCGSGQFCSSGTCASDCFISGVLVPASTVNPANACQVCTPATSTTTWTTEPDGTSCASGEVCSSGACVADCFLRDVLILAGTGNPANACQVCTPAASTTSWSSIADGTTCNDGNACTQTDACQAGACTGTNPVTCMPSDACHAAGTCDPTSGTCSNPTAADGTVCPGGTCAAGVCAISTSSSSGGGAGTGGSTTSSSSSGTGTGGATATSNSSSGCSCQIPDESPAGATWLLGALPLLLLGRRRSRAGARLAA